MVGKISSNQYFLVPSGTKVSFDEGFHLNYGESKLSKNNLLAELVNIGFVLDNESIRQNSFVRDSAYVLNTSKGLTVQILINNGYLDIDSVKSISLRPFPDKYPLDTNLLIEIARSLSRKIDFVIYSVDEMKFI